MLRGEGRIMDIQKLIDFNKAKLACLATQQEQREPNEDKNLFEANNGIDDLLFQQQSHQ